jgi:hypothetical protein
MVATPSNLIFPIYADLVVSAGMARSGFRILAAPRSVNVACLLSTPPRSR